MRTADMIKSKYWRGKDLEGQPPVVLTISDVSEELMGRGGHQDVKCFMWFREHNKGLQLNKTRVAVLEAAYGPDSVLWVGRRVRLSYDPSVEFGGKLVGGVRVETQAGVVYKPSPLVSGAVWGDAPKAPPGAPPPPVWDEKRQMWITPAPPVAAAPSRPPPPVWNEATKQWETVDTRTGEIAAPAHRPPPTISERVAAGSDRDQGWGDVAPAATEDFNDDIPF